jgi:uncharacterized protein
MPVRFTVENRLSFHDRVEFSLVASEKVRTHPDHVIRADDSNGPDLLKLGLLFGANASSQSHSNRMCFGDMKCRVCTCS